MYYFFSSSPHKFVLKAKKKRKEKVTEKKTESDGKEGDGKIPRKLRHKQEWPVERERQMMEKRGLRI